MRVVYLHQYFKTPAMSGGTRSYEMARRLVESGHQVHMITSDPSGAGAVYETNEAGIRVTWIPVAYSNSMGPTRRIGAFVTFAIKSALLAARSKADLIFATSTPLTIAIPAIYAKWRQKVPMVFEVRDLWPEIPIALDVLRDPVSRFLARQLERFAYRNSSRIVALSPGIKEGVVSAGYAESQVTTIPNACDVEQFAVDPQRGIDFRRRFEWLGDRPMVVYTGTIGQLNGLKYMVELARQADRIDSEVRFVLVGGGKEEEDIKRYAEVSGVLNRNFFMLGTVSKAEIPAILSAADICMSLFINLEEMWTNSANKFFDGLAAGRPIAINYWGWQAELLLEHNAGLVLSPTNIDLAAKRITKALSDSNWLRHASNNASVLARSQFDRDTAAATLEYLLLQAVGINEVGRT